MIGALRCPILIRSSAVTISKFPESNHALVSALSHHSDPDLLTLCQRHPDQGRFFVALFCRYSPIVLSLIHHSVRSPVQADYLFAVTWRHIFHEMGDLDLREGLPPGTAPKTLQSWLINITAACINQLELPPVESINYSLETTSPPLWCYVERSLDLLTPLHRLIILMAQTFHWSETRISAYLQAEGELMSPADVHRELARAYQEFEAVLPADIREIYLDQLPQAMQPESVAAMDNTEDFFDLAALGLEPRSR
jgi:hypothetical protein